jgi:hypothetical protein
MSWFQLDTCERCGAPVTVDADHRERLDRLFADRGNLVVRFCEDCRAVNAMKVFRQLAKEGRDELIDQGDCIGDGEL